MISLTREESPLVIALAIMEGMVYFSVASAR